MMNWRNIKNLDKDDYCRPALIRIIDKGCDEPRYAAGYIRENGIEIWGGSEMIGDVQSVHISDEPIPDSAHFIRIDEILF